MNSLLMNEIFENTVNKEHDKPLQVKIQLRDGNKRSKKQEFRICIARVSERALNPRDNNCVKQVNGQIMLNGKELTCVASWSERIAFIKKATKEVAKKMK